MVEQDLLPEQGAGDREQTVGDGAQGTGAAVAASAQRGIAVATDLVVLDGDARPVIERVLERLLQA